MPSLAQRCPSLRITHANQCTSRGCSSDRAAPVGGQSVDGGPGRFCRLDGQAYPVAALWSGYFVAGYLAYHGKHERRPAVVICGVDPGSRPLTLGSEDHVVGVKGAPHVGRRSVGRGALQHVPIVHARTHGVSCVLAQLPHDSWRRPPRKGVGALRIHAGFSSHVVHHLVVRARARLAQPCDARLRNIDWPVRLCRTLGRGDVVARGRQ